jgi:predicted enzyme related to lactoylglutathione lyase
MTPSLASITFDCADPIAVARFWAAVLDRTFPDDASDGYVQLAGEPAWSFVAVPERKTSKNRVHVDLDVADLASEVDRLVGLGASRLGDFDEQGYRWTTLADPEGNEFDVVAAA